MKTTFARAIVAVSWVLVVSGLLCFVILPDEGAAGLIYLPMLAAFVRWAAKSKVPYPSKTEYMVLLGLVFCVMIYACVRAMMVVRNAPHHNW